MTTMPVLIFGWEMKLPRTGFDSSWFTHSVSAENLDGTTKIKQVVPQATWIQSQESEEKSVLWSYDI